MTIDCGSIDSFTRTVAALVREGCTFEAVCCTDTGKYAITLTGGF